MGTLQSGHVAVIVVNPYVVIIGVTVFLHVLHLQVMFMIVVSLYIRVCVGVNRQSFLKVSSRKNGLVAIPIGTFDYQMNV